MLTECQRPVHELAEEAKASFASLFQITSNRQSEELKMGRHWNKLKMTCPFCGHEWETEDSREFSEDDDLFMFTSGMASTYCPNCKSHIENTEALFAEKFITICEVDKYIDFLNNQLPDALLYKYGAPDRVSYRERECTTLDWFYGFIRRLCLQFPDDPEIRRYMSLLQDVKNRGISYLTELRVRDNVSVFRADMIPYPSCLSRVHLPDSVKEIAPGAFADCKRLSRIYLPSDLHTIGESAFKGCTGLSKIHSPDQLKALGDMAFMDSGLEDFWFPSGLKSIGERCFSHTRLKTVYIPSSVRQIGELAFSNCKDLSKVTLPAGFEDCSSLFDPEERIVVLDNWEQSVSYRSFHPDMFLSQDRCSVGYYYLSEYNTNAFNNYDCVFNFVNDSFLPKKPKPNSFYAYTGEALLTQCRRICEHSAPGMEGAVSCGTFELGCGQLINVPVPDLYQTRSEAADELMAIYLDCFEMARAKGYKSIAISFWPWRSSWGDKRSEVQKKIAIFTRDYLEKYPSTFQAVHWYACSEDNNYDYNDSKRFSEILCSVFRRIEVVYE